MALRENLFQEFSPVTTREWMDKITADLKGADFKKKLVWKTREGFEVMPFYRREDIENIPYITSLPGEFPWLRGAKTGGNGWLIRQNINVEDYRESNRKALTLADRGVQAFGFKIKDPDTITYDNIRILLEGLSPENYEINFSSEGKAKEIVEIIIRLFKEKGQDPSLLKGAFEADPLGRLMLNGRLCTPVAEGFDYLASLFSLARPLKSFRLIHVNASFLSDAGADTVTSLAYGLAMGNEYLNALTDRGVTPGEALSKIRFSFGTGSNYFFEIARLRAARLLWALIADAWKPDDVQSTKMEIHCVTGRWNKTIYDPYVNMLRTQTESMSAILGGTDSLTVEPFDIILNEPNEFSERIARNQQLLLREEAFFGKVADPAGGSYYIEKLTDMIADHAWKLFVDTEKDGGFLKSLEAGTIQRRVKACASARMKDISGRKEILTGTTQYPDFKESAPRDMDFENISRKTGTEKGYTVEPLPLCRGAEEIEKLRYIADKSQRRPVVFMLKAGNQPMAMARAQFSCNFFACGGYRVIDNPLFSSIDEGLESAKKAEADIIVLCSSDDDYAALAPELLKKNGSKAINVVAGNPPCMEELKEAGLRHFISIRSDLAETLNVFHRLTGLIDE